MKYSYAHTTKYHICIHAMYTISSHINLSCTIHVGDRTSYYRDKHECFYIVRITAGLRTVTEGFTCNDRTSYYRDKHECFYIVRITAGLRTVTEGFTCIMRQILSCNVTYTTTAPFLAPKHHNY